jgi:phosphoribosylaminoimidazolecarboxamide formyltransferase/IMP cyclohydrolase
VRDLRYGENPHQRAALYEGVDAPGIDVLQGKALSFTNLLDVDAAYRIAAEFDEPAAVVVKHTNPCGAATAATLADAYVKARDADPLSAFGGIVGLNRAIDAETARAIGTTFIEAVIAPDVEAEAKVALAAKTSMRVVVPHVVERTGGEDDPFAADIELRTIRGGVLLQTIDRVAEAHVPWPAEVSGVRVVTRREPSPAEWEALRFAWRICAHVKSNAVVFTARDRTLAIGAGQMSRVDAVRVAVMKAGAALSGSVAASDAFFPFRDGVDAIAAAGATAIVQPGGSVRDAEVIAAADEHGIAMVFTGRRHFRH